ncbi:MULTISPECIES: lytic transglycosylase domain-containing protein [Brevundimonas]|uniref:lytic transglycosylase domain-containing protein n=1 Tax=Brevundimonas TaxID=41275 RepID=UPI0015BFD0CF|nr:MULTISPECIES: lytic transglycosylase domain-containing protein [Brevundimonas]MBD3832009.1 lytic transglycosylase domain-containing protein [Brevundimonas sp.]MBK1970868.1 lytic transglycosylase domain-containing protein [Brevundimonas diminuta]NWE53846.1 lytic transglycosylase domain-containing protein [Brevundimonas sp. P7753]
MSVLSFPGRRARRAAALALALAATSFPCVSIAVPAASAPRQQAPARSAIDDLITEAAHRFGLPPHWIRAVMQQESGFNPRATSRAGAMGLMQVMPATYAELRRRHGLGPDAYDPRDNIMAGAAYLRELHDRFGLEGMLPAYNAGPGRYLQHRGEGRPLPLETRDYVARIGLLDRAATPSDSARIAAKEPIDPYRGPLFPDALHPSDPASGGLFVLLVPASDAGPVSPR